MAEQSWILDVVDYLDAGSTSFTKGTNLFANVLPDEVRTTTTVGVFEVAGRPAAAVYGDTDAYLRPTVQIIARSTMPTDGAAAPNPTAARNAAWVAYRRLKAVGNTQLSTASPRQYGAFEPEQAPYLLDTDEEGRQRFTFTAGVWMTPSTGPW